MHLKGITRYVLPAVSILFIIESINAGYGVDILTFDHLQRINIRSEAGKEISRAEALSAKGDFEGAEKHLFRSLQITPLIPLSYLELSRIYLETGEHDKANTSIGRAYELSPRSYENLWEIAILAFRSGNEELARECLVLTSRVFPHKSFTMAWNVLNDGEFVMNKMVDKSNLADYLHFLISGEKPEESLLVWRRLQENGVTLDDRLFYRYVDFLIQHQKADAAYDIWTERFGEPKNGLVWNGGFEREITGKGFDWKVSQGEGFAITYDTEYKTEGHYSLKIIFDGEKNVDFRHVSKFIPVNPGSAYLFTSNIRTEGITSNRGVLWTINCYPSPGMNVRTSSLRGYTGSRGWTESSVKFTTPEHNCSTVRLYLRRLKSKKLDKYIAGNVWIDGVNIEEIALN